MQFTDRRTASEKEREPYGMSDERFEQITGTRRDEKVNPSRAETAAEYERYLADKGNFTLDEVAYLDRMKTKEASPQENALTAPVALRRPNKYADTCASCRQPVRAGEGQIEQRGNRFVTVHADGCKDKVSCRRCGTPLQDAASRKSGLGPECRSKEDAPV